MRTFRTTYIGLVAFVGAMTCLTSCDIEASGNGKLDGFWHLERVDTLATGGVTDYSDRRIFWGVQHKLISVKDYEKESFYCRFQQTGDSLVVNSPHLNHGHQDSGEDGGDIPMTEVSDNLRNCGINQLEERFRKLRLTNEEMTLVDEKLILIFKRF